MAKLMETVKSNLDPESIRQWLTKLRYLILGKEADKGLLFKLFIYVLLIDTAYIYINPLMYMISTMIKDVTDLLDPSVVWVPRTIYFGSLQEAWDMLKYPTAFRLSMQITLTVAIAQTVMCAVAGYAFARLDFPLKNFWMFCLLLTFIVPPQVTVLPSIIAASQIGWMQTYYPIIIPAFFGHGLKGALFVIIFRQFFATQPKELEEAAKIDGASAFKTFYRVMLPLARPAILVVFLFAFVWTWNDYYRPNMFMYQAREVPLAMGISRISAAINAKAAEEGPSIFDEPIKMASAFLMIIPPLLLYTVAQRWFVEGVERTGIVE